MMIKEPMANPNPNPKLPPHTSSVMMTVPAATKETTGGQAWNTLFTGTKLAKKGMSLVFILPKVQNGEKVVELSKIEIEKECAYWKQTIILYVIGASPTIATVAGFIASNWNFASKPRIYYHNDGYFIVRFNSMEDRNEVIYSGPQLLNNRPLVIKPWSVKFDFAKEVLKIIPLWVKFPNLPLNYWSMDSLSRISSGLGNPLYVDECTTQMERISYARVLIELDIIRPRPNSVKVADPHGKEFDQAVAYDWKSIYCGTCCQLGHDCSKAQNQVGDTTCRVQERQPRAVHDGGQDKRQTKATAKPRPPENLKAQGQEPAAKGPNHKMRQA
ncbi:uncharacterized protein LOC132631446 [Lycium barbarum]|uniref:uncharacterized protein LOC132631446 n=1 Tax=Lycium barbarum TaxID=112863 RepID=UPI00293ED37B|nr:uncharacterized protein LOC132631446 [Lycium barbarum]